MSSCPVWKSSSEAWQITNRTCAKWGFDEEDDGCRDLKLELAQKIMELRQQGVTRFAVVADCGIGLYAGEIINIMRETDSSLMLFVVTLFIRCNKVWRTNEA